jgi:hypothetical protein
MYMVKHLVVLEYLKLLELMMFKEAAQAAADVETAI